MEIQLVKKLSPVDRFCYWISERHSIFIKRKNGEKPPWTDDEILQAYFFTNPYRENDKTTVWFRENVREPLRNDPAVLFATVCFRWFNYIPTGEALIREKLLTNWNTQKAVKVLQRLNDKVFTGAFNISNSGSTKPKIKRVCEDYVQPIWEQRHQLISAWDDTCTMEGFHSGLSGFLGMGGSGFMAYEVVCDLRYTYLLENAGDKLTWSNMGPGAKRGINRLLGRSLEAPVKDWLSQSAKLLETVDKKLSKMPKFEMREIEHSLCEWDKMERLLWKDGRSKRKYNGQA